MKPARILVATGASGGHIFPALAFLEALKDKYPQAKTLLLLPEKSKTKVRIDEDEFDTRYISLSSVSAGINRESIKSFLAAIRGILQSIRALLKFHPDIVVGFGSAASVPAVIFGWLLRAKTIIHEQNVIPGKATRLLAEFSDKIAISFEASRGYFKRHQDKIVLTGNPLRKQMAPVAKDAALGYFKFDKNKLTVLVMGGSQGSRRINEEFLNALTLLSDKQKLQVIHLSGRQDYVRLKERYQASGVSFALFDFFGPMNYAYCAADIALSRSGATTAAELIFFALPAMLSPYPYAYDHQHKNAKALEEKGCAFIIKDQDLNRQLLKEKLEALIADRSLLEKMRRSYSGFKVEDAAGLLVKEALS
ncbi:MAG: undecaprenyldiphospho-muramoylpentapeptide beta-N-acetylglucosaminyltransferase [Candidatus Omnitrophota bacterium]